MRPRGGIRFSTPTSRRLLAGTCLAALVATAPRTTLAADAPADKPAEPADKSEALETVVVTTRYVREDIQSTPMAIIWAAENRATVAVMVVKPATVVDPARY